MPVTSASLRSLCAGLALGACSRDLEDPADWFDQGERYSVEEPVAFTDAPYGELSDDGSTIAGTLADAFSFPRDFGTYIASDDLGDITCTDWIASDALPVEVTGVVTILPRYYFKANGCTRDDEKYYGSYFIEDDSGGMFVLGDSKVAWFDAGDTVTLEVRGTRRSFGQNMIYVHQVVDVQQTNRAVRYVEVDRPFGADDINEVRRISGTVVREPDTFGETRLQPDGAEAQCNADTGVNCAIIGLDAELNRRGVTLRVGEHVTATGPILFSFDTYKLIVMRVGQIQRL